MAIFGDFRLVWEIVSHSQGSIGHVGQFPEDFLAFFADFRLVWAIFGRSQGNFGHFWLFEGSIGCHVRFQREILVIFGYLRGVLAVTYDFTEKYWSFLANLG